MKSQCARCEQEIIKDIESSSTFALKVHEQLPVHVLTDEESGLRKSFKIDEDIRKSKLREVKRMKEELEQRLASLNENVTILAIGSPPPKKEATEKVLSKEEKQKLEEELEKKRKEASEFILKLKAEKAERKRKEEERRKAMEEKMKRDSEELNRKLKEKEEELLKRRKEESMKAYEQLKKKREEDQKKYEETRAKAPLPPKGGYLYKKIEERFNEEVLTPMLEDKKRELAKKRNLFKPLNKEEFDEHMKKYELLMAQKEEARQNETKARKEKELTMHEAIKKLQTHTSERQGLEEIKMKEEREKKKTEKMERREKMESYANLIRDTVPIKVSDEKAQEMKTQIEGMKHPVRQSKDTRKLYELASINKRSLKEVSHSMEKIRKDKTETDLASPKLVDKAVDAVRSGSYSAKDKGKAALKTVIMQQALQAAAEQKERKRKQDYLGELRKKREENSTSEKSLKYDWKNDLKDTKLNPTEKYNRLVGKAGMIEEQAKMKEKLLQAKGGTEKNPEMGENVSDMFIDAIKAKLAILENL